MNSPTPNTMRTNPAQPLHPAQRERRWQWGLRIAGVITLLALWEWFGRTHPSLLLAPFSAVPPQLFSLLLSKQLYSALWISNQALIIGYAMAVVVAIPLGIALGCSRWLERFTGGYLTILIVTPMSAIIPLVIVAVGLGLSARVLVVFLFSFPIIVLNTRAGLHQVDESLLEMARAFNASNTQVWKSILLPSALPGVLAGMQLGLARALSGMIIVELILIAAGMGKLMLQSMSLFEPQMTYALIIVIVAEIFILMAAFRWFQKRCLAWQSVS